MTRPLVEPSTEKEVALLDWRAGALERRVIESADAGIDSAVYMEFINKTIGTGAMTNLTGGTVGQEIVKGDAMTVDNTSGEVTFLEDGIYLAFLNVLWFDTFAFAKYSKLTWVGGGAIQDNSWQQDVISETDTTTNTDSVSTQSIKFVSIGGTDYVAGSVRQDSGTDRDIQTADFTVVQLAAIAFP